MPFDDGGEGGSLDDRRDHDVRADDHDAHPLDDERADDDHRTNAADDAATTTDDGGGVSLDPGLGGGVWGGNRLSSGSRVAG